MSMQSFTAVNVMSNGQTPVRKQSSFLLKKNPPTYQPIGEMEGQVQETNIFLKVTLNIFIIFSKLKKNVWFSRYITGTWSYNKHESL